MQVQQNSCERIRSGQELRQAPQAVERYAPGNHLELDTLRIISLRRSCRQFTGEALPLEDLARIMAFAYRPLQGCDWWLAPGLLDSHVVALNVDGMAPGVYRFSPDSLQLLPKRAGDFKADAYRLCLGQELGSDAAFLLVHTSDLSGLTRVYGDRGYRYACMDAGQIGQRLNLASIGLGHGESGIGGYFDDQANTLLDLPLDRAVLYVSVVGVPSEA